MPETRQTGWPKGRKWADAIEKWTGQQFSAAVRETQDRYFKRKEIHFVTTTSVDDGSALFMTVTATQKCKNLCKPGMRTAYKYIVILWLLVS